MDWNDRQRSGVELKGANWDGREWDEMQCPALDSAKFNKHKCMLNSMECTAKWNGGVSWSITTESKEEDQ